MGEYGHGSIFLALSWVKSATTSKSTFPVTAQNKKTNVNSWWLKQKGKDGIYYCKQDKIGKKTYQKAGESVYQPLYSS